MIRKNKAKYNQILKKIIENDVIVIFRHVSPDFDALGTQYGLATWIKDNFKNKKVLVTGKDHSVFSPRLYPSIEQISDEEFPKNFLAIVVDTADMRRIDDKRVNNAREIIKFDHHPEVDPYASISIVNEELSSCSELVCDFIFSQKEFPMSKVSATYFYSAIVGDSGRFLFSSVNGSTLRIAAKLIDLGVNISEDVYLKMYMKSYHDLEIMKYVLNKCVFTDKKVAYYVLEDKDLKYLNITQERGKENLSLMSNLEDIEAWMSITEDIEKHDFRVSIRSKRYPINEIANKYDGGGHELASGGRLKSLDELDNLVKDLQEHIAKFMK